MEELSGSPLITPMFGDPNESTMLKRDNFTKEL